MPEEERKNHPRKDEGGYYEYRESDLYADFDTFAEAVLASRDRVAALNIVPLPAMRAESIRMSTAQNPHLALPTQCIAAGVPEFAIES